MQVVLEVLIGNGDNLRPVAILQGLEDRAPGRFLRERKAKLRQEKSEIRFGGLQIGPGSNHGNRSFRRVTGIETGVKNDPN